MDPTVWYATLPSPVGALLLLSDGEALTGLYTEGHRLPPAVGPSWRRDPGPFRAAEARLLAYFDGEARPFDIPLAPRGTDFQRAVWAALREIPFGDRISYGELARRLGRPAASRAVGRANGLNPISILVPCHRVVGSGGALTGYAGGLECKRLLLEHEARRVAEARHGRAVRMSG
ncbi:methylated-DNA--[protein]-cysteine S-methyltransferase [Paludisphaera sp.]|uniref:methylated-DNA--[protein]-cysteine S-methyltransferase n=1 Tax=Paludisphaera sp. TaxID=2017432 RepID=UPI00301BAB44